MTHFMSCVGRSPRGTTVSGGGPAVAKCRGRDMDQRDHRHLLVARPRESSADFHARRADSLATELRADVAYSKTHLRAQGPVGIGNLQGTRDASKVDGGRCLTSGAAGGVTVPLAGLRWWLQGGPWRSCSS